MPGAGVPRAPACTNIAHMFALQLTPAALSALLLAAHFLRRGQLVPCALCLAMVALLFQRSCWAPRIVQVFLIAGAGLWATTIATLVPQRAAAGEPWQRLAAILGAVMLVALAGAALLGTRRVQAHYCTRDV